MSNPPQQAILTPPPADIGEPFSVGIAHYRTDEELAFHLRALRQFSNGRLVVVLGVRGTGCLMSPDYKATTARLILTSDAFAVAPELIPGSFEPDPFRAVVVAMTSLGHGECLILLFPADWEGPSPEFLIDQGRRWRATQHSAEDDEFFALDEP